MVETNTPTAAAPLPAETGSSPAPAPDSENLHASSGASTPGADVQLLDLQDQWRSLLSITPREGDAWYAVPQSFLDAVFNAEGAVADLVLHVGKLDCSSIVDASGNLYPEHEEPVPLTHIPPELFHQIASVFGLHGDPVIRNIVLDDGVLTLERFPPYFVVHTLTKAAAKLGQCDRTRCTFLLSLTKTFRHLVEVIQASMFKSRPTKIRAWFITADNVEDLPPAIPIPVFVNKIQHKKIVGPKVMNLTLKSQGIRSSRLHVVVESMERATRKFALDLVMAATDHKLLDFHGVSTSGGNLGLANLGNTCYMNSALQCLVHLPEINYYFFFDLYERELNRTNPLGNRGEVAVAFSNLLHRLFDVSNSSQSYVTPREFKYTVGRFSSMFHGYQQQDSQEFLSWLLDALHEDLNRIHDKPYLEKPELKDEDVDNPDAIVSLAEQCWSQHKQRNDSIIVDLFTGMYQSTLVCPTCSKMSVTFDPFSDLTLPLPVNKKWYHEFTIVDLSGDSTRNPLSKLEVELTKSSNFEDLLTYLSDFLSVPTSQLFLFEVFRNFFYKNFQESRGSHNFLPVSEYINEADDIVVYIIPHDPLKDMIVPVINIVQDLDKSYNVTEPFGIPLFIVLNKEEEASSFGTIRRKVEQVVSILSKVDVAAKYAEYKGTSSKKYYSANDFPLIKRDTEDAVMVDGNLESGLIDESDGYNSDISFAHPSVSAAFGFEIKSFEEDTRQGYYPGGRFGKGMMASAGDSQSLLILHAPRTRPLFNNLAPLADKLPELKRNYYHYTDYSLKLDEVDKMTAQPSGTSDEDSSGYVIVELNNTAEDAETPAKSSGPENEVQMSGDESDEEPNWGDLNPLLSSVDHLGGPLAAVAVDSDRDIGSGLQSPGSEFDSGKPKHENLITNKTTLVLDWDSSIYDQFFKEPETQAWENMPNIPNPALKESKRKLALQQKATISLYDCLRNFNTPEVLGDHDLWYCPRCKDHKRATKTIQIWLTGDILTIHLKRFQSARSFSDKINMVVDFPIEGLDMKEFVSSHKTGEPLLYDLIGVDNHFGGLGGGHYTASAKNFRDGKWYYFNDGRVTQIDDPQECVSEAAYLLFYKKRGNSQFAGGAKVEELINEGRETFEQKLNHLRTLLLQIQEEIDLYNTQLEEEQELADQKPLAEAKLLPLAESEDDEDLYEDGRPESPAVATVALSGLKKSRSPIAEQAMKFEFENQRKQRLISKNSDLLRSVNINMGYSSSVSNLASPTGSSEDETASIAE